MYNALADFGALPHLLLDDGIGISYRFEYSPWWSAPWGTNVVYAFVNERNEVGYIGRAEKLDERISSHEKRDSLISAGYRRLYVHRPGAFDPVHFVEAERRLISRHNPPFNVQHNVLAGLLSGI